MNYCPKCKSKLFPDDEKYIQRAGVCSYCVTYDTTPDKRFQKAFEKQRELAEGEEPCPVCGGHQNLDGKPWQPNCPRCHGEGFIEARKD